MIRDIDEDIESLCAKLRGWGDEQFVERLVPEIAQISR
jgi:hypothetical protein